MKLSICMMVKNEEQNLPRCLESIKPLLDNMESELIIVDTGSDDQTVEIARRYTNQVYFHEWNNHFGDMRNITFSYATGEWIFILDADEEVENPDTIVNFFKTEAINKFNSISVEVKNYVSELEGSSFAKNRSVRFVNRIKNDVYYKGVVHNQLIFYAPVAEINVFINHYGYVHDDAELMEKKFNRTSNLLKKELEKDPENVYYWYQLAVSYAMHKEPEVGRTYAKKAFDSVVEQNLDWNENKYIMLYRARLDLATKNYRDVLEYADILLKYAEGYLDTQFYLGNVYSQCRMYDQAIFHLDKYVKYYLMKDDLPSLMDSRLIHYSINNLKEAINGLTLIYKEIDDDSKLVHYWITYEKEFKDGYYLKDIVDFGFKQHLYAEISGFYYYVINNEISYVKELETYMYEAMEKDDILVYGEFFGKGNRIINFVSRLGSNMGLDSRELMQLAQYLQEDDLIVGDSEILYQSLGFSEVFNVIIDNCQRERFNIWIEEMLNKHLAFKDAFFEHIDRFNCITTYNISNRMKVNQFFRNLIISERYTDENFDLIFEKYYKIGMAYIRKVYNPNIIDSGEIEYLRSDEEKFFMFLVRAESGKQNIKFYLEEIKNASKYFPHQKGIDHFINKVRSVSDVQKNQTMLVSAFEEKNSEKFIQQFELLKSLEALTDSNYSMAGITMIELGAFDVAEEILLEGIKSFPQSNILYTNLHVIYKLKKNAQLVDIIDYFIQLTDLAIDPDQIKMSENIKACLKENPVNHVSEIYDFISKYR